MKTKKDSLPLVKKNTVPKLYRSPQLIGYGNIQQLTKMVGNMGASDNGTSPMHKTSAN